MTRIRKPTLDKPTPDRYVAAELSTVGLQSQTNGYFPHAVMVSSPHWCRSLNVETLFPWNDGSLPVEMSGAPAGLGHHQAGPQQHRHLPGRQHEQVAEDRVPAAAAAAGAEERRRAEDGVRPSAAALREEGRVGGQGSGRGAEAMVRMLLLAEDWRSRTLVKGNQTLLL